MPQPDPSTPALAFVIIGRTPYNVHLAERIAAEIPELRLVTVFPGRGSVFNAELPASINAFEPAEAAGDGQRRFGHTARPRTRPLYEWRQAKLIDRHLREAGVVAMILSGYASFTRLCLLRLAARSGLPVFLRSDSNVRGDRAAGVKAWAKRRLLRWVIRRCAGVMPVGQRGVEYFARYGASPEQMYLVPFEPEYALFESVEADARRRFMEEHGLKPQRRRLLFCGRLVRVKRADLLLDAFAAIASDRPDWDLLVAGDGPLRDALAARHAAALEGRVRWLGFCGVPEVRLAYHASDALVVPSDHEPWGLVVNEAVSAGLALVASDAVGAAPELVKDGVNGRIFAQGDEASLRQALLDVTDSAAIDAYRRRSPEVLAAWRAEADPVAGVRTALRAVGVLPE